MLQEGCRLLGDSRHDAWIRRLLQHDDIRCDRANDRRELSLTAGSAEANVVAEETQRHADASAFDSACSRVSSSLSAAFTSVKYG